MDLKLIFLILIIVCGVIYSINKHKINSDTVREPIRVISFIGFIVFLILFAVAYLK